ncbi:MAG: S8 family serine peptidase [Chloroflexota bacterium]
MFLLLIWVVTVSWMAQLMGWSGDLTGMLPEDPNSAVWASLVQAVLLLIPLGIGARAWKMVRYRAMTTSWLAASGFVLLLAPTRLFPLAEPQWVLLCQILLTSLYGWLIQRWILPYPLQKPEQRGEYSMRRSNRWPGLPWALVWGALCAYPWVVVGSVGSPLDLLLNLALGLLAGWVASLLINRIWLRSLAVDSRGLGRDGLTGGFVIGTTLLILSSGLSLNGVQLLLMLALSAVGWLLLVAADTHTPHVAGRSSGPGWLVGSICAVILIFSDTDGTILQAVDGLLGHYFAAAGLVVVTGLVGGFVMLILRRPLARTVASPTLLLAGLALWLTGGLVYHLAGQSGFYGDSLFVVMTRQADVSQAATMSDYDDRRRYVYDTLVNHANESQADLRSSLEQLNVEYTPYYLVNALEVRGGLLMRLWLNRRADVDRIMPSPALRPLFQAQESAQGTQPAPAGPEWNLTNLGADRVWADFDIRGAGIVIGQSDSGVQFDHAEVIDSYRGRSGDHDYNWFDPWNQSLEPSDVSGHGTHTLGSIVGNLVGVAPDAEWIGCANLHRNLGNPGFYLDCMQFMLAPFPIGGDPLLDGDPNRSAHVLNNSWGCPQDFEGCDPESLRPGVAALRAAGIFVVASAGNSGPDCSTITDSIAIYDEVFSVGAVDVVNDLAPFSSTGPVTVDGSERMKPDIVAPGVDVLSAYPNGTYEVASGTSMAGPHVAGVVALLWSANPALIGDIERTEKILVETARPFTGTLGSMIPEDIAEGIEDEEIPPFVQILLPSEMPEGACIGEIDLASIPNNVAGFGVIDAYAAVEMATLEMTKLE